MAEITRDPILGREVHLDQDETLIAVFRADPSGYWRSHVIMALVAGVIAGAALVYGGNTTPWVGPVAAVLACQHKLFARQVLQRVAPEANLPFQLLDAEYGAPIPAGLHYPLFVKPVKAAFSVLAREVADRADLHRHTRFGAWELWVIRRLVEPFERLARERLRGEGGQPVPSAHRMLLEAPVQAEQFSDVALAGRGWQKIHATDDQCAAVVKVIGQRSDLVGCPAGHIAY